jgi:hypothetical protein
MRVRLAFAFRFFVDRLCLAALFPRLWCSSTDALKVSGIFLFFEKIGDVKKRVALQPEINKC